MEWKTVKLQDVCIRITDGSHFSPQAQVDGYPMFSVKDMLEYGFDYSNCKRISKADFEGMVQNDCVPQKGDVLVAKDGSFLKSIFLCKETKEEAILSSIAIFRPDVKKILPAFLCYLLKSPSVYNYIASNCVSGSALPRIVLKDFKQVDLSIPDIETQRRIAAILSSLDDKIENNNRINRNLEAQAQALFKSWFVDFEPFGGTMPEDWREGTLGDIIEIKYGKDHKKLSDGEIPVYGSGGLMRHAEKALYTGESVLIPRKGTLNNVMYVNEAFWTVDTMFYSIPKQDHVMLYAYLYLSNINLSSLNAGSAVPSMTTEILNKMKLVIPDVHTLKMFDNKVSTLYSAYKCNRHENQRLATLRDTLLPKLMKGEIAL